MRALRAIEADPARLLDALRDALSGTGPAVFPVEVGAAAPKGLPAEVPRRVAAVVGTSGSTGRPKRVVLSTSALLHSAAAAEAALDGPAQWLLALPAQWIAGLSVLVRSITMDTAPVVDPGRGTDPAAFAASVTRMEHPRRVASLVPAQLARLLEHDASREALRRLDRVLLGGQAADPALLERAREAGIAVTTTYGSTETVGGCVWDGMPIGDAVVAVVDGRVHLGGGALADGYLDDPQRDAEAFVEHEGRRWYRTDDAGAWDGERLRVTGRLDDVIVSGGVKLDLGELTGVAAAAGIGEVLAVGVPDAVWGQAPVVLHTGAADAAAVRAAAAAALGRAAGGLRLVRVAAIPRTAAGKPDRAQAQRLAAPQ